MFCLEMFIKIRVFKGNVSCHKTPQGIQEDGGSRMLGFTPDTQMKNRTLLPLGGRGFAMVKWIDFSGVLCSLCRSRYVTCMVGPSADVRIKLAQR